MLAALHFNENGMREQATTKEGKKDMTSCFPSIKKKGGGRVYTLRKVKVECTFRKYYNIDIYP